MSMNVHIVGEREILIPSVNKKEIQRIHFNCIQTPTKDSYKILESENPIKEYKDWVLSKFKDEVVDVYADNDPFCDKDPIGTKIYNYGKNHIQELEEWVSSAESNGYIINLDVW